MQLKPDAHIYFLGIGGTGMASVAGLCQAAGYKVTGSDAGVYPPMSNMLEDIGIEVITPYDEKNLKDGNPDLVVVANVLSRGNTEIEYMLANDINHTSFAALLGDVFLENRVPIVVTGTHGKTTTCSLMAHILHELGEDPSFFIGGIPRNFPRSFRLGKSKLFILEGDEYDTAFFDKGPKFLHYKPQHLILNNLEFDHADIYENVEAIAAQFAKLIPLVEDPSCIIANMDDAGIAKLIGEMGMGDKVTRVATLGETPDCHVSVKSFTAKHNGPTEQLWVAELETQHFGTFSIETMLSGRHNLANIAQVIACLGALSHKGHLQGKLTPDKIQQAMRSFQSVKRRLDHLGSYQGVDIYEDFAHHPTAMRNVIEGFRQVYPEKRLVVAFEPRSAIQRRNIFQREYGEVLSMADSVYIGKLFVDQRIPEAERMNIKALQTSIGGKAKSFASNEALATALESELESGDAVIFMSSGSFSGVQYDLAKRLETR